MSRSTPPDGKLVYRLMTGTDDKVFCERVSQALEEGYQLYGLPVMTYDPARGEMRVAQAVLWPGH
jgi:hypothetical protein